MQDPGWYPDPLGAAYYRFHNGSEWTTATTDSDNEEPPSVGSFDTLNLDEPSTESSQSNTQVANNRTLSDYELDGWIIGQSGMIRLNDGLVEIKRTSLAKDLFFGNLRGDKTIPLRTIQAVQFKAATATVGGMIEIVVAGDRSNDGRQRIVSRDPILTLFSRRFVRMGDENIITFNRTQEPPFRNFHKTILMELSYLGGDAGRPVPNVSSPSRAEEIRELKELLDDGIITQEEFNEAKQAILKKF
jgi:hypothetical protein